MLVDRLRGIICVVRKLAFARKDISNFLGAEARFLKSGLLTEA